MNKGTSSISNPGTDAAVGDKGIAIGRITGRLWYSRTGIGFTSTIFYAGTDAAVGGKGIAVRSIAG